MGPRGRERWVPQSSARPDFSRISSQEQDKYLNGGAGIRGGKSGHKEYNLTWNGFKRDEMRPILDMADGLYDTGYGNDLIYFLDPTSMDRNVLSSVHAAPFKHVTDGLSLIRDKDGYPTPPILAQSGATTLDYPVRAARYSMTATHTAVPIYVPIPPGHTAWVGVHGVGAGITVTATPVIGSALATPVLLPYLSVSTTQRFNHSLSREATGATGLELALKKTGTQATSRCDLTGIMVQILPDGTQPMPGGFISGRGNSGCEFASAPSESPYLKDKLSMSAKLVETGAWR